MNDVRRWSAAFTIPLVACNIPATINLQLLKDRGLAISMSAKGHPYDNAFIESFFKTLNAEEVYLWN